MALYFDVNTTKDVVLKEKDHEAKKYNAIKVSLNQEGYDSFIWYVHVPEEISLPRKPATASQKRPPKVETRSVALKTMKSQQWVMWKHEMHKKSTLCLLLQHHILSKDRFQGCEKMILCHL